MPLITCLRRSASGRAQSGCGSTHTGLEIDEDCSGDVSSVVALIVEDIFAITAFSCKILEVPVLADSVLLAELLPELAANCVCARRPLVGRTNQL